MPRGSAPGERRGGRQKGVPNKATACLQDIAREYTTEAIEALAEIVNDKKAPHQARVGAAIALLDRGYGRPSQTLNANLNGGAFIELLGLISNGAAEEELSDPAQTSQYDA